MCCHCFTSKSIQHYFPYENLYVIPLVFIGYMNKNIPSRVYIIDGKNTTYFNILDENDELVYSELEGIINS